MLTNTKFLDDRVILSYFSIISITKLIQNYSHREELLLESQILFKMSSVLWPSPQPITVGSSLIDFVRLHPRQAIIAVLRSTSNVLCDANVRRSRRQYPFP